MPRRFEDFDDSNLEERCEIISAHLVRLKDKLDAADITKEELGRRMKRLPSLDLEGLDKSKVQTYLNSLSDGYQYESIVPEAFRTSIHELDEPLSGYVNIGFAYRLPRHWFLPFEETRDIYSNDHLFRQFGRNIALGEREYFNDSIMHDTSICHIEEAFSPHAIDKAFSIIRDSGYEPNLIFPIIKHWVEVHHWSGKTQVRYDSSTPRPVLDASLIVNGTMLKVIHPLGKTPRHTIIMDKKAIKWHLRRFPQHGSLYAIMGNDRLYPKKYVEVIVGTNARCEIEPRGIVLLEQSRDSQRT